MPMKNLPHPSDLIRTESIEALGLDVSKAAEVLKVRRPDHSPTTTVPSSSLPSWRSARLFSISVRLRTEMSKGGVLIGLVAVAWLIAVALLIAERSIRSEEYSVPAPQAQIDVFMTALAISRLDTGTYPTTVQGLTALRTSPVGVSNWKGPYLPDEVPMDPWGRPYVYRYPSEHGEDPDVVCYGADGLPGGIGKDADFYSWVR